MFSFMTVPFLILTFSDSILVWGRLYYYGLVAVFLALGVFASPATRILNERLEGRQRNHGLHVMPNASQESVLARAPVLGLPADPEKDLSEAVAEIQHELGKRSKID
jgi:lysophospholipid acyltransferase